MQNGGAELCLDWDRSLVPMKYCLRFEEGTSADTASWVLSKHCSCYRLSLHPASQFELQSDSWSHARARLGRGGVVALAL